MAEQMVWARDRDTGNVGEYTEAFLAAWPNSYLRVDPPKRVSASKTKTKRSAARSASTASPEANSEGGA